MTEYLYVLGVPNFANYEATAALIRVPRRGGAIDYVTIAEERLARTKHAYDFPLRGIDYCLRAFGLESLEQVDFVYTDYARVPRWLNSGPGYRKLEHDYLKLRLKYPHERIRVVDHHDAHAASAFYPSGFDDAAVLVVDALGSRLNTQTLYHFRRADLKVGLYEDPSDPDAVEASDERPLREQEIVAADLQVRRRSVAAEVTVVERGDHWGIGRLYSLVTGSVLPYGPEKGFGKTMGLAPYGRMHPGPVLEFGAIDAGMTSDYSAFCTRAPMSRIVAAGVRRCDDREAVLDPYFARAAYDVQQECERQMVRMARYAYERTGSTNICIAGGVGLNGLSNARVLSDTPFERIFITPGCSDTGIALGLALWGCFHDVVEETNAPVTVSMPTAYTGTPYAVDDLVRLLSEHGIEYERVEPEAVAALVASGKVIGWFEGGSEFGPRALGHRSIVADPRDPDMKDTLNKRVKFREPYRPYAPSILAEHAAEWLHLDCASPFMLLVVDVREDKRALIPAVTHVDHTTRPQTVTREANPNYYRMIREFHRLTGVPMVLNTSLNVNREPIVETPLDLLICAFGTAIDYVYAEGLLIDARRYASPELVARLTAIRARRLEDEWRALTERHLTRYDRAERDAYLAEENRIAEWHRDYRAKYELESRIVEWLQRDVAIVIAGTRGHTRCLYEYIADFPKLDIRAFVALDDCVGEPGSFDVYRESAVEAIDWSGVDAVLVSTHEYQNPTAERLRRVTPSHVAIVTIYDDAGDSLLSVLPGRWPVVNAIDAHPDERADADSSPRRRGRVGDGRPSRGERSGSRPAGPAPARARLDGALDIDAPVPVSPGIAERYALIVNYHYCHPPGGFLEGTNTITPAEFDAQLRVLRQNFVCTTMGELIRDDADLPEVVAVVTFDDGLKDVVEHALPLLQRWGVPATIFCSSAPLAERQVLNVHRGHLLQARLGQDRFRQEFERALADRGSIPLEAPERLGLRNLHVYDDEATRRFKIRLNFEVPYAVLDGVLRQLSERFVGLDDEIVDRVYMTADELRRCQDAGLEIGGHGHRHRVMSRLAEDEQQQEITLAARYFADAFGVTAMPWAYPWGFAGTWNETTTRLLERNGFSCAATMVRAIVKPADLRGRWQIPRFDVRDVFDERANLRPERLRALFTAD